MKVKKGTLRKDLFRLGCSGMLLLAFNREYGYTKNEEELATGSLCGGVMQTGHQCGMLWGASLGASGEVYRKFKNPAQATEKAIEASRELMVSFEKRTNTPYCREVTGCDPSKASGLVKLILLGKPIYCMNLGVKWAPKALESIHLQLDQASTFTQKECLSCASEVARKMGASEEESISVAGFAGGLGLSGGMCGALSAAIWIKMLEWIRAGKSATSSSEGKRLLRKFRDLTNEELLCKNITGKEFGTAEEHSQFIQDGGCLQLIEELSKT